jgi:NAD+ diphosphatase
MRYFNMIFYLKDGTVYFERGVVPPVGVRNNPFLFLFRDNELLVLDDGNEVIVPCADDLPAIAGQVEGGTFLGILDDTPCYCAQFDTLTDGDTAVSQQGMLFSPLRPLLGRLDDELFKVAGLAFQIVNWVHTQRYCGRCGNSMEMKRDERAMECPRCGFTSFPRISPAIIVAVTRDNRILLARANRFPTGLYSVLAGFVEPGETLEECLRREVKEEVGVEVEDVRYFGSQPWPFPHSLMIGFTALYAAGELKIDPVEIDDAGWFTKDKLPRIPPVGTIARSLIDWFVKEHR